MRTIVDVNEVEKLIAAGAQVVEVLSRSEYDEHHLPGALSIPLAELPGRVDELDRDRAVVVYCYDTQCDLSPRAAALLVQTGHAEVYDFVAGKMAWLAAGLPSEGWRSDTERAGAAARSVPTCDMADDLATVKETLAVKGLCVVVNGERVVLGLVSSESDDLADESLVGDVMDGAPHTIRPSMPQPELRKLLETGSDHVLVTTYSGELLGIVRRQHL